MLTPGLILQDELLPSSVLSWSRPLARHAPNHFRTFSSLSGSTPSVNTFKTRTAGVVSKRASATLMGSHSGPLLRAADWDTSNNHNAGLPLCAFSGFASE